MSHFQLIFSNIRLHTRPKKSVSKCVVKAKHSLAIHRIRISRLLLDSTGCHHRSGILNSSVRNCEHRYSIWWADAADWALGSHFAVAGSELGAPEKVVPFNYFGFAFAFFAGFDTLKPAAKNMKICSGCGSFLVEFGFAVLWEVPL